MPPRMGSGNSWETDFDWRQHERDAGSSVWERRRIVFVTNRRRRVGEKRRRRFLRAQRHRPIGAFERTSKSREERRTRRTTDRPKDRKRKDDSFAANQPAIPPTINLNQLNRFNPSKEGMERDDIVLNIGAR